MPNSTDYTARNASSKNTIVAEMVAWSQVFEVKGFSRTKGLGVGNLSRSRDFPEPSVT
jgi:hypothetical protein